MSDNDHVFTRVGRTLNDERLNAARAAGAKVLGERGGPGREPKPRADVVAMVQRGWPDPAFRRNLRQAMIPTTAEGIPARNGVENFEALLAEAFPFGHPADPPPPPPPAPPPPQQQDYGTILSQIPPDAIQAYLAGLVQPPPGTV